MLVYFLVFVKDFKVLSRQPKVFKPGLWHKSKPKFPTEECREVVGDIM